MKDVIHIFTDGSSNPKKNDCAGVGVFIPEDETLNVSCKFPLENPTNQRAELFALFKAYNIINQLEREGVCNNFIIYSDSMYSIKCITEWYLTWQMNGWKNSKKEDVKNKDIIQSILEEKAKALSEIKLIHVNSHTKRPPQDKQPEFFIWSGNDRADNLAKSGKLN